MLSAGYFGRPLRPSLLLDLRNPAEALDSRVTFTRASSARRTNSSGVLEVVSNNVPRFDCDPVTLALRGLLIEEARTNPLLRSAQFDNAAWSKSRSGISADSVAAPDGTASADKLVEDATTGQHGVFQLVAKAASAVTYTASIYLKAAERTGIRLLMEGASSGNASTTVNLAAGTVSTATVSGGFSAAIAAIEDVGGGWYCATLTATSNTNTGVYFTAYLLSGASVSYAGDGTSGLYLWGAQLEAGAFATSYIATTTAPATRAADVATMATSAFPFDPAAGAIVARYTPQAVSGTIPVVTLDDGTANERIRLVNDSGTLRAQIVDGGVTQADISLGSIAVGTTYRIALAWAANDIAACVNGGPASTDASATIPTVSTLTFGQGWHAGLTYYPRRLSNAELQQVTS